MKKLKVAIIGCGSIAESAHLPAYQAASDRAEIAYFVDVLSERAQKLRDHNKAGKVLTDYRDMLQDDTVDCVSVCTPNHTHAPISIDCLQAGKHVICEKPVATRAELAEDMQKAAAAAGRILNVGVVNRYNTAVEKIRELITAGTLGSIYQVYGSFRSHRSIPGLGGPFTTRAKAGGGVLIDWGVHFLDLIWYCIGQPQLKTVSAVTHSVLGRDISSYVYESMWAGPPDLHGTYDVEDFVSGLVRTSGPTLSFNGAWAQNIGEDNMSIDFLGDAGGIRMQYFGGFKLYTTQNGMLSETSFKFSKEDMFAAEIRDFLDSALRGEKSRNHIDETIATSQLMELIYESAQRQSEIRL